MAGPTPPSAQPPTPERPAWWLLVRVLDEPAGVFRSLEARPRFWLPIIALVVGTVVTAYGLPDRALESATRRQLEVIQRRMPQRLTDSMVAAAVSRASDPAARLRIVTFGTGVAILTMVIAAGVLMLIFGSMAPEPIRFGQEFAVVTHAYVPQILGALLIVVLTRFAGFEQMQLSLGFLFDPDSSPFLYAFAAQLSVFGAWGVVLLALGNQILSGRKSLGTPIAIVGGLWLMVHAAFAGLAALAGRLAGG